MKAQERLDTFLKKHRVYRKFYKNKDNHTWTSDPHKLFVTSFAFNHSPEGHDYWWRLHLKWNKELGEEI